MLIYNPTQNTNTNNTQRTIQLLEVFTSYLVTLVITVSTLRGVSSPAPLISCPTGMVLWASQTNILFTAIEDRCSSSSYQLFITRNCSSLAFDKMWWLLLCSIISIFKYYLIETIIFDNFWSFVILNLLYFKI